MWAWRLEERGETNATRTAREILVARIRAAEFAADHEEGGGARRGGHALPGTRTITMERRVLDVYAECAAEEAGRHPRLVRRGDGTPSRGRKLREEGGRRDIRWGLLMEERDEDEDGDDASRAKWTWLETLGNATSHSTAQFLVATDGSARARVALVAALSAAGGAVTGYLPVAAFSVVGSPATAAAAEAVSGVIWVGPLTPADRTARAWDVILPLLADVLAARAGTGTGSDAAKQTNKTARDAATATAATALLSADDIVIDGNGRAVVEVVLPSLISLGNGGVAADVQVVASLVSAAAREFAAGVAAATSDTGAWAQSQPASNTVLVGVRPESLAAAVTWLGAHRAAHWVEPHLRRVPRNRESGEVSLTPTLKSLTPYPSPHTPCLQPLHPSVNPKS